MQAVGAPAGRLLFIKVPSALQATQHDARWEKQPENNRNVPLLRVGGSWVTGPKGFILESLNTLMFAEAH